MKSDQQTMTPEEAAECLGAFVNEFQWRTDLVAADILKDLAEGKACGGAVSLKGLGEDVQEENLPSGFFAWVATLKSNHGALALAALFCGIGLLEPRLTARLEPAKHEMISLGELGLGHSVSVQKGKGELVGSHAQNSI